MAVLPRLVVPVPPPAVQLLPALRAGYARPGEHLKDEVAFLAAAKSGHLPQVSFVKPLGNENEHPGYSSEPNGSDHLVDLIQAIETGPQAKDTLIIVTYDEFGGAWDHVSPPGLGTTGAHDQFGPGTRVPALLIAQGFNAVGRRPHGLRHDLDHGDHRAPVRSEAGRGPRRRRPARPVRQRSRRTRSTPAARATDRLADHGPSGLTSRSPRRGSTPSGRAAARRRGRPTRPSG